MRLKFRRAKRSKSKSKAIALAGVVLAASSLAVFKGKDVLAEENNSSAATQARPQVSKERIIVKIKRLKELNEKIRENTYYLVGIHEGLEKKLGRNELEAFPLVVNESVPLEIRQKVLKTIETIKKLQKKQVSILSEIARMVEESEDVCGFVIYEFMEIEDLLRGLYLYVDGGKETLQRINKVCGYPNFD